MTFIKFEDINVWQKSIDYASEIYKHFSAIKDFSFKYQICRAWVSISNNIAEGFDRGNKIDFFWFLKISRGSCSEVKSILYLAVKLSYISNEQFNKLCETATDIHKKLNSLIIFLSTNAHK